MNTVEQPSDHLGRWFACYEETLGTELFSARLFHQTDELGIAWTVGLRECLQCIAQVESKIGRKLTRVTGTASNDLYWPFSLPPADNGPLPLKYQAVFWEESYRQGYESFRFGAANYGARSESREGVIIERGRTRWEVRLSDAEVRHVTAYVDDFSAAGHAVQQWLGLKSAQEIIAQLNDHLIVLPGLSSSYEILPENPST